MASADAIPIPGIPGIQELLDGLWQRIADAIGGALTGLTDSLSGPLARLADTLGAGMQALLNFVTSSFTALADKVGNAFNFLDGIVGAFADKVRDTFVETANKIGDIVFKLSDWVGRGFDAMTVSLEHIGESLAGAYERASGLLTAGLERAFEAVSSLGAVIGDKLAEMTAKTWDGVSRLVQATTDALSVGLQALTSAIPEALLVSVERLSGMLISGFIGALTDSNVMNRVISAYIAGAQKATGG